MQIWQALLDNRILLTAAIGWTVAQVAKTIIHIITNKTFSPERLVGGGGMPSSHSATVCALSTAVFIKYGFASTEFAIAFIFSFIVMYDAMGVRRETGNQAKVINEMREFFIEMQRIAEIPPEERLKELIGHTPLQVLIGAITGVIIGIIVMYI